MGIAELVGSVAAAVIAAMITELESSGLATGLVIPGQPTYPPTGCYITSKSTGSGFKNLPVSRQTEPNRDEPAHRYFPLGFKSFNCRR